MCVYAIRIKERTRFHLSVLVHVHLPITFWLWKRGAKFFWLLLFKVEARRAAHAHAPYHRPQLHAMTILLKVFFPFKIFVTIFFFFLSRFFSFPWLRAPSPLYQTFYSLKLCAQIQWQLSYTMYEYLYRRPSNLLRIEWHRHHHSY